MFSDRGMPDTLGYARLIGMRETDFIESVCRPFRYASLVFLAPPWKEIYTTDSERKQNFAEAVRTFEVVGEVYRECGYEVAELPKGTPRDRARFILEQVNVVP
jgi:predicted ATPase